MKFKSNVMYSSRHGGFVARERTYEGSKRFKYTRLSGVHKVIKKVFFPNYKYADAVLLPRGLIDTAAQRVVSTPRLNSRGKKDGRQRGTALGKLVMKQLRASVLLYQKYSCPKSVFFDKSEGTKFARTIDNKKQKAAFLSRSGSLNTHTEKIWSFLDRKGLNPVAVDCPVGAVAGRPKRMGTGVDLVCVNFNQEVTLFEIKSGYTKYLYKHTHVPMRFPFADKNDCPLHQHFIQLLLTAHLYQHTFPDHKITQAVLLRADRECVEVYPLPDWITSRRSDAVDAIAATQ